MEKNILLLDGNSLINRAYYAIQRPMMTKDGLYTQAIFGFLNMLQKLQKDYEPGYAAVCFDLKAPTFRHKEYAEYKAGRKKMPPELAMEIPVLKDVLRAMNIAVVEQEGWEADDFLGTLSLAAEKKGLEPLVVTGDKDSLQLASDKTRIIYTKRGVSEFELYDTQAMEARYGLTPTQFIDLKGLMGDSSDNIPGIPGVGEKTALPLLQKYGSVEAIIEHAEEIPQKGLRAKVEEFAQSALMSKRLATIARTIPPLEEYCDLDELNPFDEDALSHWNFEAMRLREPDKDQLIALYKRLEFNSFLRKLSARTEGSEPQTAAAEGEQAAAPLPEHPNRTVCPVETEEHWQALEQALLRSAQQGTGIYLKVHTDDNHRAIPQLTGAGLLAEDTFYWCAPGLSGTESNELARRLCRLLKETGAALAGHQLQSDLYALYALAGEPFFWLPPIAFDSAVEAYLLNPSLGKYDLDVLYFQEFHCNLDSKGPEAPPAQVDLFGLLQLDQPGEAFTAAPVDLQQKEAEEAAKRALDWCQAAEALRTLYEPRIREEQLQQVWETCDGPLIPVMALMEEAGFAVDKSELARTGADLLCRIEQTEQRIYELAGEKFNISSPKQLGTVLFERLMLPAGKKNKSGYSTSAEVLENLRPLHPIVDEILNYRQLTKLRSTYIEGMLPLIHEDGRIHAHFQQTVASTGRISCTEPNLQNIPVRQEEGRKLRKAFIAEPGSVLVAADYSQIELRILACLSGDGSLLEAFRSGQDIHRATAAKVLHKSPEDVTPEERSGAKAINFGIVYGMSSFGLSEDLHISVKAAEQYIHDYFAQYPTVQNYLEGLKRVAKEKGYAETVLGRKRAIPELKASQYMVRQLGERLAMNSPIQGTAADVIKLAMVRVQKALLEGGYKARLILQVHDELILHTPLDEVDAVQKLLVENMEQALQLAIPFRADLNRGENWYLLK